MEHLIKPIALALNVKTSQVKNTLDLLAEGATIPFIARYRKEVTGGLDEEQIRVISENYEYQVNLEKRKEDVARLIETQGKLTDEIKAQLSAASKLSQVEDIYRPYQQKRKTRASEAIKKGLKPLADYLLSLPIKGDVEDEAEKYLNAEVASLEEALQGAKDIIAEMVSDDLKVRENIYNNMLNYGKIVTKEKQNHEDVKKVYKLFYDYNCPISRIANHTVMAIDRAEKEKVIGVSIEFNKQYSIKGAEMQFIRKRNGISESLVKEAIEDGCSRLAFPSIERQIRNELSEKAHLASMDVFSMNLEKLLLQPPLKGRYILGFDPAFRTGCKLAVIDPTGKMLEVSVIYPHQPNAKIEMSKKTLKDLCTRYPIQLIAIGNGTASRESEQFVANFIHETKLPIEYIMVSEAGASVYSASELAREEFPELHVEQRSAISIARRVQDPLAELIKIDPQSIGVGQYQHDIASNQLKKRLDFVVEKAVNLVGVNVNTASAELLKNVSGLSNKVAKSIVAYREENGRICNREELKKVKSLGAKAFEQAAGFLRIEDGEEVLDRTSIHPESYRIARQICEILSIDINKIGQNDTIMKVNQANIQQLCEQVHCDEYTCTDILDALKAPLRDYRERYDMPLLRSDVLEIEDLHVGDALEGTVRNVVDFGAFVDIGLHEDGLVHIKNIAKQKVTHPSEVVSVGDIVKVWVSKIDEEKGKVQLTMIEPVR